jgi:hypothetical protein
MDRTTERHFFRKHSSWITTEPLANSWIFFCNVDPTGSPEDSRAFRQHPQANTSLLLPATLYFRLWLSNHRTILHSETGKTSYKT